MLGFVASNLELIDRNALVKSIETSVRKDTIALNLQAFESGYEYSPAKEALA
jgi:Pyruvate/2-oxoacid:ferredoxin oxidoreductase gamma subunit